MTTNTNTNTNTNPHILATYLICPLDGEYPMYTNNLQVALDHAVTEEYTVVNLATNHVIQSDGSEGPLLDLLYGD